MQAIRDGHSRYGPSLGIPEFRQAAADYVREEYGLAVTAANVVAGPGAQNFEQLFCEAFLNPGDGVLVFSPHFPTYPPNIAPPAARLVLSKRESSPDLRPTLDAGRNVLAEDARRRGICVNSPPNPRCAVPLREELQGLANSARGRAVAVFTDETYDRMAWTGRHHSLLEFPGM